MTAFIAHQPKPTDDAGTRALCAAGVGLVLVIVAIVAGSLA